MKLRVKTRTLVFDRQHPDVGRQPHVQRPLHRGRFELYVGGDAGDLRERVHPRVCPARADDRRPAPATPGERLKRFFD
ncbi:hypothetical protein D3C83_135800 [compost metagenome]